MKKLLFSILMVLGLFILGCGKDGETGSILSKEDKSRPKLELQDVNFDGKTVKQIVIIPADEEEQAKLYERALKSQEEFAKTFPNLQEEAKTTIFEGLRSKSRNSEFFIFVSKMTNLENTYQDFIKNNKELRNYISEKDIEELYNVLEHKAYGQADKKIDRFNNFLIYGK